MWFSFARELKWGKRVAMASSKILMTKAKLASESLATGR
jgi:hypothetical protein